MQRIAIEELIRLLRCPDCAGEVLQQEGNLRCLKCARIFRQSRGKPVLMRSANALFDDSQYCAHANKGPHRKSWRTKIKSAVPSRSVNLSRSSSMARMAEELRDTGATLLILGSGMQASKLQSTIQGSGCTPVFCDVNQHADVDLFCDGHDLPFRDGSFDAVITTAVLEHVLHPNTVAAEIARVSKPGGLIYSELPFLQSVHEGAYDFTRFTLSGHRSLLRSFEELQAGATAGPGTALVWALSDFSASLFRNRRLASAASLVTRMLTFWLKYTDHLTVHHPRALDAASCTYFLGRRRDPETDDREIISRYEEEQR